MKKIKLIADSTCDLSQELIEKYDISIIPLQVNLGDETKLDMVSIFPDDLYAWANANNTVPKTSAPTPDSVQKCFEQYADCDIIAFTISGELSSTYQLMRTIADDMNDTRITVIDSRNLSTGIGLLIMKAAHLIEQGKSYEEIIDAVNDSVDRVRAGFVVEDVLYLRMGGRCSALAAFGATALKLRPTLAVRDGSIKVDKKVRGDMLSATMKYAMGLDEIKDAEEDVVFITHSGTTDEIVKSVKEYVESLNIFKEIYITRAGCVISSHCGAGTLGVLFIKK